MSQLDNRQVGRQPEAPPASDGSSGPSPARVFVVGAVAIVAVIAVLLAAIRIFLFPVWETNIEGARQVATAEAQLTVARTQEALVARPSATTLSTAATRMTVAPTTAVSVASTPAPVAVAQTTIEPSASLAQGTAATPVPSATTAPLATVSPEQAAEIAAAYQRYWEVRSEALLDLDPAPLADVAAGESLAGLQKSIEDDRAQGRALQTNVEHEQVYVVDVQGDEADVADRYKDSSIYVDPDSHTPLPGQVAPASPDVAPAVSVLYHLQRVDGAWKVVSGQRFVPQDSR